MKPILLNSEEVRAVLDGRKTQVRRLIKRVRLHDDYGQPDWNQTWIDGSEDEPYLKVAYIGKNGETVHRHYPRYQVGDVLYVRETWLVAGSEQDPHIAYKATVDSRRLVSEYFPEHMQDAKDLYLKAEKTMRFPRTAKWRPSIHMPKWAARIFLEVTGVRVEMDNNKWVFVYDLKLE